MALFFRTLWWRVRYAVWYVGWRIALAAATWRVFHGVKVGLASVLNEQVEARVFSQVQAALDLIATYAPRRLRRITRDFKFLWIRRAGYAPAYFIQQTGICVLDRQFLAAAETTPALVAAVIVHEATHARLEKRGILYLEPLRPRIEALCDAQSVEFARRLPDGESLRPILERHPVDPHHWSNERLDGQLAAAEQIELEAAREDLEQSDLPSWLKRMLRMVIRWRAA